MPAQSFFPSGETQDWVNIGAGLPDQSYSASPRSTILGTLQRTARGTDVFRHPSVWMPRDDCGDLARAFRVLECRSAYSTGCGRREMSRS